MATGRQVRATLADRRTYDGRPGLSQRAAEAGIGGVLVMVDCHRNRIGTYEAFNALSFPPGSPVLLDGVARVCAPMLRADGTWRQSVQHLRTGRATACEGYADVVDAVFSALSDEGPGRAGAIVRGWHSALGGAIGFEIGRVFDPECREYLDAGASFDAFLASPDVFVAGLGASATGERCMGVVSDLMDSSSGTVVWEVIPKRTYSMGGYIAEAAALTSGRDSSRPYRMDRSTQDARTGCLPSIVGFVSREGVLWPKVAKPLRTGIPVPEIRVATARTVPGREVLQPVRRSTHAVRTTPFVQRPMAGVDPNAPAPLPPDLLPGVAAAGPGSPDLGGPGGYATEDLAAVARLATPGEQRLSLT
jgi:hypothetical protein